MIQGGQTCCIGQNQKRRPFLERLFCFVFSVPGKAQPNVVVIQLGALEPLIEH